MHTRKARFGHLVFASVALGLAAFGCGSDDEDGTGGAAGHASTGTGTATGTGTSSGSGGSGTTTSSGSGTVADGQTYTVSGSGFGTRVAEAEWLGGLGGFIDGTADGARFDEQNRPGWSLLQPSTMTYPHITAERAWSRGQSVAFDVRGTDEYKQTLFYDTGASGYTHMYTNALIYLDYDDLLPDAYLQWKIMRWYKVADVQDHAQNLAGAYMSHPMESGHVGVFTGFNLADPDQYTYWFDSDGHEDLPPKGAWYRYETWLRMNSVPGAADGMFRVRATDPADGTVVCDNLMTDVMFNAAGDEGNLRYLVLQNYFGNGSDLNPAQKDNANAVAFWDDVYIRYGTTDDVFKRVVIGDAATLSEVTNAEIQPVASWTDGGVSFTINQGGMTDLAGKYVFLLEGVPESVIGSPQPL